MKIRNVYIRKWKDKITLVFILLFILSTSSSTLFPQVTQEWVARYNGPGNNFDDAYAIAVDGFGNVYVTGGSTGSGTTSDYATIKYNSSGEEQWTARYNGIGNDYDCAYALAIDSMGNTYVTGESIFSGVDSDYVTIKYDSTGAEQWTARYKGPGNDTDYPSAIAVDGSGNVYITGGSKGSGIYPYNFDYATIKYNSEGVELWSARYNGPEDSDDFAWSIAVDGSGNVYVTGESAGLSSQYDYATIKYNSLGVEQWVMRYNGPGNSQDYAKEIVVDSQENVYIAGYSEGSGTSFDYATIKYDNAGVEQWVTRYDGPGSGADWVYGMAIDSSDNIYVTGFSNSSSTYTDNLDYATVKYNSSGVEQWVARYDSPANDLDWAEAIAVDRLGNVYVTGWSYGPETYADYVTIKYNSAGVEQWIARYNGVENIYDCAFAIAVDYPRNVYVTGRTESSGTYPNYCDYGTIKYSQITFTDAFYLY